MSDFTQIVCINLKCNGYVLVLIEVELIHFVCSKCIRSIWTKTNTNIITTWKKKRTVVWPSIGMIIMSNERSQQTPSAKGKKGKNQGLDQVSCPDTEIQVLPNLGIAQLEKRFLQPTWSECIWLSLCLSVCLSVCLSICLWVRAKRGVQSKRVLIRKRKRFL